MTKCYPASNFPTRAANTCRTSFEQNERPFRLFVGYAGWAGGQLESELEDGQDWLTTKATREDVFSDDDDLWHRMAQRIGSEILAPAVRTGTSPEILP